MKIYISADMEGISSIFSLKQTTPGERDYQRARKLMTEEINTVIQACYDNGATQVIVNDSHNDMDNILIEELHPRAKLISGSPKPLSMMEGIDESFDLAFFIGYHARPGTPQAVIDHTYTFRVLEVKINGQPMSEAGLNGRLAGYYGVPVALVTGDQKTIECSAEELNEHVGVVVKKGIGRGAALVSPYNLIKEKIEEGVSSVMHDSERFEPTTVSGEIELEVSFYLAEMAEMALLIPNTFKNGDRSVIYKGKDYLEIFNVFRAMLALTSGIK